MKRLKLISENFVLKSFVFALSSIIINFAFLFYNLFLGLKYGSIWNYSISIYYFFLFFVRAFIVICEKRWEGKDNELLSIRRRKLYISECSVLLVLDALMVLPITLMILSERQVRLTTIPAIAVAAYTTYKVTLAIINYRRAVKVGHLSVEGLRIISLTDAVVAVITLQNTLIAVFGEGEDMTTLTSYTSAGLLLFMVLLHIWGIIKIKRKA